MSTIERKDALFSQMKFAASGDTMTFSGYGAVFGNMDSYGDVIAPGAFTASLAKWAAKNAAPAMLLNHGGFTGQDEVPIGLWTSLIEDNFGLKVEGKLADTERGREVYSLLKMQPRPALRGLSIGFRTIVSTAGTPPSAELRTLNQVELWEISLVTFPANDLAQIGEIKAGDQVTKRTIEERLVRDVGLSRKQAKSFMAHGFAGLTTSRDAALVEEICARLQQNIAVLAAV